MTVNDAVNHLKERNNRLEETLVDGFVNETTVQLFPIYFFEYVTLSREAQLQILKLSDNEKRILSMIISYAKEKNQDWIPLCADFCHIINNDNYYSFVNDINCKVLDKELIETFLYVCRNSSNFFNIYSLEELIHFDPTTYFNDDNTPNSILLTKYGISYRKAYSLYERYGKYIKNLPDSKEKEFLIDIRNILKGLGTDTKFFEDKTFIINIDSILRNYFAKIYSDSLYKTDESKKIGTVDGVDLYDAGVDFYMSIYSYGMATHYEIPENYKEDWNRPRIETDYLCNSIISPLSMKTSVKHCIYGFDNIGNNELALLGPSDLGTGNIYHNVNITNPFYQEKLIANVEFQMPQDLLNNTRFANNELYRCRRRVENGRLERINPNYIVYLKKEEDFQKDPIWQESINAAKDFGIPIVIVDCEKCLLESIKKLNINLEIFESSTDNVDIVPTIIEMYNTIFYGYNNTAPQLLKKHLDREDYVNRLFSHIDKMSKENPKKAMECIDIIMSTVDKEYAKILKSPYWVKQYQENGNIIDKPNEFLEILKHKKKIIEEKISYHLV